MNDPTTTSPLVNMHPVSLFGHLLLLPEQDHHDELLPVSIGRVLEVGDDPVRVVVRVHWYEGGTVIFRPALPLAVLAPSLFPSAEETRTHSARPRRVARRFPFRRTRRVAGRELVVMISTSHPVVQMLTVCCCCGRGVVDCVPPAVGVV